MNDNDCGVSEARNRLREKAQNAATCVALNDLLKAEKLENKKLREENERLRENAKIISELERRLAIAVEELKNAKENISDWGEYASTYFQEKYDLKGDIEHINVVLATLETKN